MLKLNKKDQQIHLDNSQRGSSDSFVRNVILLLINKLGSIMLLLANIRFGIIVTQAFCQNTNADSNGLNAISKLIGKWN